MAKVLSKGKRINAKDTKYEEQPGVDSDYDSGPDLPDQDDSEDEPDSPKRSPGNYGVVPKRIVKKPAKKWTDKEIKENLKMIDEASVTKKAVTDFAEFRRKESFKKKKDE